MDRRKTHWCTDRKHEKCGGEIYRFKSNKENRELGDALSQAGHEGKCRCECHSRIN